MMPLSVGDLAWYKTYTGKLRLCVIVAASSYPDSYHVWFRPEKSEACSVLPADVGAQYVTPVSAVEQIALSADPGWFDWMKKVANLCNLQGSQGPNGPKIGEVIVIYGCYTGTKRQVEKKRRVDGPFGTRKGDRIGLLVKMARVLVSNRHMVELCLIDERNGRNRYALAPSTALELCWRKPTAMEQMAYDGAALRP